MLKRAAVGLLICALSVLAAPPPAHAQVPSTYTNSISVTSTATAVSFGLSAIEVVVANDGSGTIYINFGYGATAAVAVSTDNVSVPLKTCETGIWVFPRFGPATTASIVTASGQTASARLSAHTVSNYTSNGLKLTTDDALPFFTKMAHCQTTGSGPLLGATIIPATASAPVATFWEGQPASGSNTAGANFTLAVGPSTGNATPGSLIGQVSPAGASGTTAAALVNAFSFNGPNYSIGGYAEAASGTAPTTSSVAGTNGTGTNVAGGQLNVVPGLGTGNAAGAAVDIQRNIVGASGTSQQTAADALKICGSKTLSNTSATLTTLATIALASNSAGSADVDFTVTCTDGTNFNADRQRCTVGYVNKAGTLTIGTASCTASVAANNSGSCTVAPTFTAGTNSVNVNVTPVITTITPTTTTGYATVMSDGSGAVTCN